MYDEKTGGYAQEQALMKYELYSSRRKVLWVPEPLGAQVIAEPINDHNLRNSALRQQVTPARRAKQHFTEAYPLLRCDVMTGAQRLKRVLKRDVAYYSYPLVI